jgi:hypothetical protein
LFAQENELEDLGPALSESNFLALQTLEATLARSGLRIAERKRLEDGSARLIVVGREANLAKALSPLDAEGGSGAPEMNVMVLWDPNSRLEASGDLAAALESLPEADDGFGMPARQMNAVLDLAELKRAYPFEAPRALYITWELRPDIALPSPEAAAAVESAGGAALTDAQAAQVYQGLEQAFALKVAFFPDGGRKNRKAAAAAPIADPAEAMPATR